MTSGIYQTENDEIENIRLLLQSAYERRNHLVNLNIQFTGIISALAIGIISFLGPAYFTSGDQEKNFVIILAANLIIIDLLFWRYYAHIIDDDVAKTYKQIVFCENMLNIPSEIGLLQELEKSTKLAENPLYCAQNIWIKISIVDELINRHRIGYRFHKILDLIASAFCIITFLYELHFVLISKIPLESGYFQTYLVILPIGYLILLIGLWGDIFPMLPIQREPKYEELDEAIALTIRERK